MAKIALKNLKDAGDTDILCQAPPPDFNLEILGYLRDWFVSGKKVHVRVENIHTGEIIPYSLDTPDMPQAWFIVNDENSD